MHWVESIPYGTVLDPATTRAVTAGAIDPVSGRAATQSGFVRDPFGSCGRKHVRLLAHCLRPESASCRPSGSERRQAAESVPRAPQPVGFTNNFTNSPGLFEHKNAFDVRVDFNPSAKDQVFGRFSYADDPAIHSRHLRRYRRTAAASSRAIKRTNPTSRSSDIPTSLRRPPSMWRASDSTISTPRASVPRATLQGIPAQFGIQGVPQVPLNGGLPAIVDRGSE